MDLRDILMLLAFIAAVVLAVVVLMSASVNAAHFLAWAIIAIVIGCALAYYRGRVV